VAACHCRLAPGERVSGATPAEGQGQYWLVLDGSIAHLGTTLDLLSCAFVYPDDSPFTAIAGARGASLLAMQFPKH
jgi:hypothetical protein